MRVYARTALDSQATHEQKHTPVAKKQREREIQRQVYRRRRRRRACVPLVIVLVARVLPCNDVGH